mgnify:CR=1 FL=1
MRIKEIPLIALILYGFAVVSMAIAWALMFSEQTGFVVGMATKKDMAAALEAMGGLCLSTGFAFHAMGYVKVECNMSSLPLTWKISAIPAWLFIWNVVITCSELAILQFGPENNFISDQISMRDDPSSRTIFNTLRMSWLLLPSAWFYFRFDRRDPKFTRFILSD